MSNQNIESLRTQIKEINEDIVELIAQRVQTAKKIGELKRAQGKPIHQPDQEAEVLALCEQKAKLEGLDSEHIKDIFELIIAMSRRQQLHQHME